MRHACCTLHAKGTVDRPEQLAQICTKYGVHTTEYRIKSAVEAGRQTNRQTGRRRFTARHLDAVIVACCPWLDALWAFGLCGFVASLLGFASWLRGLRRGLAERPGNFSSLAAGEVQTPATGSLAASRPQFRSTSSISSIQLDPCSSPARSTVTRGSKRPTPWLLWWRIHTSMLHTQFILRRMYSIFFTLYCVLYTARCTHDAVSSR